MFTIYYIIFCRFTLYLHTVAKILKYFFLFSVSVKLETSVFQKEGNSAIKMLNCIASSHTYVQQPAKWRSSFVE